MPDNNNNSGRVRPQANMGRTSRTGGPTGFSNNYSYTNAAAGANVGPHATAYESYNYNPGGGRSWWYDWIPISNNEAPYGSMPRNPNNRPIGYSAPSIGTSPYTAKGQAGYYSTGPDQYKNVSINGQNIRMGPNSYIAPPAQVPAWLPSWMRNKPAQGQPSSVRGSVPNSNPYKGAMPTAVPAWARPRR